MTSFIRKSYLISQLIGVFPAETNSHNVYLFSIMHVHNTDSPYSDTEDIRISSKLFYIKTIRITSENSQDDRADLFSFGRRQTTNEFFIIVHS